MLSVAACGSDNGGSDESASSGTQTQSTELINVKPTGPAAVKVGTQCGDTVPVGPSNKDGVYATMPKELQDIYASYPDALVESPWATKKITAKPPWKIGYITIGISNQ